MKNLLLTTATVLIALFQAVAAQGSLDRVLETNEENLDVDIRLFLSSRSSILSSRSSSESESTQSSRSKIFENCEDNVHLLCDSPNSDFTILCLAIEVTGLGEAFDTDGLTIFAPSDDAFENLGVDTVQEILLERRLLEHLLLFHVVTDVLEFDDLHCREPIRMANGEDSRTVCAGKNVFQKGAENSRSMMPEIVQENVETCQGFVHVVDQVLLPGSTREFFATPSPTRRPTPAPTRRPTLAPTRNPTPAPINIIPTAFPTASPVGCQTITEIICSTQSFSTLCSALQVTGLDGLLNGSDQLTLFAPTNDAFAELGGATLVQLQNDVNTLKQILLLHLVHGVVLSGDLKCTETLRTLQGQSTRTVCSNTIGVYQKATGNSRSNMPEIISIDTLACNGVIQVLDGVLIPGDHELP